MARNVRTPAARKTRDTYPGDVGNQGRKTGLTVAERERDENDMERVSDIFQTSPATTIRTAASTKSIQQRYSNGTVTTSEDMVLVESSEPTPSQYLNSARRHRGSEPPPMGRSPIKTPGLGPARRPPSTGPLSSPLRNSMVSASGSRLPSIRKSRRIDEDLSSDDSLEVPRNYAGGRLSTMTRGSDVFTIHATPSKDTTTRQSIMDESEVNDNGENTELPEESYDQGLPQFDDETTDLAPADDAAEDVPSQTGEPDADLDEPTEVNDNTQIETPARASPKKRGRKPLAAKSSKQPAKKKETPVVAPKKKKAALTKKNANAKANQGIRVTKPTDASAGPLSLQYTRELDPGESYERSRSGRVCMPPLAYWKNERVLFERNIKDPAIAAVIRKDDRTPKKRPVATGQRRRPTANKSKKRAFTVFEEDEDDDGAEEWEVEEGVVTGLIKTWNSRTGLSGDDEIEQELAFAADHMETRPVPDANFLFAKTFTLPHFGTGIVELPPKGFKRTKNSRHFQMCFFVHYGKVVVEILPEKDGSRGTKFTISKGGMWQVPRGNFYAISNETEHDAKVFFAQGREIEQMVEEETLDVSQLQA